MAEAAEEAAASPAVAVATVSKTHNRECFRKGTLSFFVSDGFRAQNLKSNPFMSIIYGLKFVNL